MQPTLPSAGLAALFLAAAATSAAPLGAEVRLPAVLGDHMVLQRDATVPLWGWARPNMPVSLRTSWSESIHTTVCDAEGRWRCDLRSGPAGGPHRVWITDGEGEVVLEDVLFGEVWLCSGQSNMEWPLRRILDAYRASERFDAGVADLAQPRIRLFTVPKATSAVPLDDCAGAWTACDGESALGFSAVAYFFARALAAEIDVPIGLVGSYWGGTPVEAWTSRARIAEFAPHRAELEALDDPAAPSRVAAWWDAVDAGFGGAGAIGDPALDVAEWTEVAVPGAWESGPLGDVDGIVWFRREVELDPAWADRELVLSLGAIDDDDRALWNGAPIGCTEGHREPRRYVVPGRLVRSGRNVLCVTVHDSGGAGGFHGAESDLRLECADGRGAVVPLAGTWRARASEAAIPPFPRTARLTSHTPSALYNAMIAPLGAFRFAGVLWYQGESNTSRPELYRETFPAMIRDWRRTFEAPGAKASSSSSPLPFFWAQLAPFRYDTATAHQVALLHEAQDSALSLPRTGQVVLTDAGDPRDIHPLDKWTVGERFARWALATVYGRAIDASGPRYAEHAIEGGAVRVRMDHAEGGLAQRGDALTWFHVAGEDRKFVPADARIEGASVIVSSPLVPAPVAVRFGWSDAAEPNLFDLDGLPAAPFRTDDWDDVEL